MTIRTASAADLPVLLDLMRGYYRDDGLAFDEQRSGGAMMRLLAEPQWGRVWLLEEEAAVVGYLALCIGFSLEFGGNDAFIDELFVLPGHRGRGHARALLACAVWHAPALGIRALHLEVDRTNLAAQRLYESMGYQRRDRSFILTLATPRTDP
jgi:ribosomal protein S18 acetylase RimI-like enzyme